MVTNIDNRIWSDLAIPPGELLEEEIAAAGLTQHDLAVRTGRPAQVINEIIRGKKAITHDTALELEKVLGIPAHVWVNLESTYQLTQAKNRERENLRNQEDWLEEFPVREIEKRGWIPSHPDKSEKVRALLEFLGVASFQAWRQTIVGLRVSEKSRVSPGALAVWLRRGELDGWELETERYDEERFREALSHIRSMTSDSPEVFAPKIAQLCGDAGVAWVVIKELPKSGANGIARWLTPEKGLIQMSLRWHWSDIFWFTFFHEAYHILRRHTREVHIDWIDRDREAEAEADAFAQDFIIPPDAWAEFVTTEPSTVTDVNRFASEIGIDPGIIVGRMHREGLIPYSRLAYLKSRFVWKEGGEGK